MAFVVMEVVKHRPCRNMLLRVFAKLKLKKLVNTASTVHTSPKQAIRGISDLGKAPTTSQNARRPRWKHAVCH